MAYISNFLLNFIFSVSLQKRGFNRFHCLGKILKNNQIIGYIRFWGNNYTIDNDKNNEIVFTTLFVDSTSLNNS